ncbi:hypothetical protein HHI36_010865 [Cryptolaemus montrouzieri]|uniref:Uncharacterized protein n=1 Tax=Cryptolaemus montrouzieri TaxID=559131 RepID=A0ABD2MK40_9CUCU
MLNKPTMYVEPYKQTNTPLGPIGSKPVDFWQNGDNLNQHSFQEQQNESINSYFSNIRNLETRNVSSILGDAIQSNDWNNTQENEKALQYDSLRENGMNIIPNAQDYNTLDPWNHNLLNSNTYWDGNNVTPIGNGTHPTNGLTASTSFSVPNRQSSYLWGSSSVWQPWIPLELPRTPTRTPPGFTAIHQMNNTDKEEPPQPQRTESYNPFASSNIWAQQQNIWKYSKDP